MKNQISGKANIDISRISAAFLIGKATNKLLQNRRHQSIECSKYGEITPSEKNAGASLDSIISSKKKFGRKMDHLARGIRDHVRLAPKLTETLRGKLSLGARIIQFGGMEKVFKQLFSVRDDEKLVKVSQCYLSTTNGPIAGLLFISTDRIAFCSERSLKVDVSPAGNLLRIYYKVSIPLAKIMRANRSHNSQKPSEKYISVFTEDDFEFWFMGFLNLQKTLKYLHQVLITQAHIQSDLW